MSYKNLSVSIVLACLPLTSAFGTVDISNSQAFTYDDGSGNTLLYRLFFPPGYDTPGATFPLVTFLHGAGEVGSDNLAQVNSNIDGLIEATRSAEHAAFLLAPQVQPGQGGWSYLSSPTELAPAMDLTLQVIDQLEQQYQIDTTRRSVTGLSMGGFGTWDIAAKRPDMFSAAAPIAGGGNPAQAANLSQVPIWNFHGRYDSSVNVEYSRDMISAVEQAGGTPYYTEILGNHSIWGPIYDDPNDEFYSWMLDGVAPPLATVIYNPLTGNLKLDASSAPGGTINRFSLSSAVPFSLQSTMMVDGMPVDTLDFVIPRSSRSIEFNAAEIGDFSGIADFGSILPKKLTSQNLHFYLNNHTYKSPATGSDSRIFRLIMEVPEPATPALVFLGIVGLLVTKRHWRNCNQLGIS